jgi:putative toxin-antitoxin system antitoxin component (TIGR02293 family)
LTVATLSIESILLIWEEGRKTMPKPRAKATRALRRSASGTFRAIQSHSPRVEVSATAKERAISFKLFVAKETPTAKKIRVIRSGVSARVVDDMVAYLDVPKNVVFNVLHTPESTAHRLIRYNRPLDSAASERVVRVADIIRLAEETFGGREAATRWLKIPNLALGATPLSMLDTEPGANEVRRILSSINYGGAF